MNRTWFTPVIIVMLLFVFPSQSLAVDYSITNVEIDAYLPDNGDVKVKETHTYNFEGEFTGITRELVPKHGSKISQNFCI